MLNLKNKKRAAPTGLGQISLEFIFAMMVTLVMIYSLIMVLKWGGLDLAERQRSHSQLLRSNADGMGPLNQIDPYFSEPTKLQATFSP